jgi:hypothetical protein
LEKIAQQLELLPSAQQKPDDLPLHLPKMNRRNPVSEQEHHETYIGKAKVVAGVIPRRFRAEMAVHLHGTQLFLVNLQHGGCREKISHSLATSLSPITIDLRFLLVEAEED